MKIAVHNKGFSLIELIIVLLVIAIMAAVAIPSIMAARPNKLLKGAARDLYSTMQRSKVEAVKRNTCISTSFNTVVFPATGGGYITFIDDGIGGGTSCNGVQDGGEIVLFNAVTMPQYVSLVTANNIGGPQAACFNGKSLVCGSQSGNIVMRNTQARWHRVGIRAAGVVQVRISDDGITWTL